MKKYNFKIGDRVKWGAADITYRGKVLSINPQLVEVLPITVPSAKASVYIPHNELQKDNDVVTRLQEIMKEPNPTNNDTTEL